MRSVQERGGVGPHTCLQGYLMPLALGIWKSCHMKLVFAKRKFFANKRQHWLLLAPLTSRRNLAPHQLCEGTGTVLRFPCAGGKKGDLR